MDNEVKKVPLTDEEERLIFEGHKIHGNKWAEIAKMLNGRTDNAVKNFFYSTLRRQMRKIARKIRGRRRRDYSEITLLQLQKTMKDHSIPYTELDNRHVKEMLEYMDANKDNVNMEESANGRYSLYK